MLLLFIVVVCFLAVFYKPMLGKYPSDSSCSSYDSGGSDSGVESCD